MTCAEVTRIVTTLTPEECTPEQRAGILRHTEMCAACDKLLQNSGPPDISVEAIEEIVGRDEQNPTYRRIRYGRQ